MYAWSNKMRTGHSQRRRKLSNASLSQAQRRAFEAELSEASRLLDTTEQFVPR